MGFSSMRLSFDFMNFFSMVVVAHPKASQAARRALVGAMTLLVAFVVAYLICLLWIISLHHRGRLDTFLS